MSGRLRSDIFVDGLRRHAEALGAFAYVRFKGHEEAGMVYIMVRVGEKYSLYGESSVYDDAATWQCRCDCVEERDAEKALAKERRFDEDLWVLEIEGAILDIPDFPVR